MAHAAPTTPVPTPKDPFLRLVGFISTIAGVISAAMILAAVCVTCLLIYERFVLNNSTVWHTEAVIYLMIGATLVGLPYVQKLRGHVSVDLLPMMLPPLGRRILAIVSLLVSISVLGVMCFHGYELWHLAYSRGWTSDTVWGPKLWVPYLALPLGLGLFILQLVADLYAELRGLTPKDPGGDAPASADHAPAE